MAGIHQRERRVVDTLRHRPGARGRVLPIGGGGFLMQSHMQLDQLLLSLCDRPRPRICFIPTASGDSEDMIHRFYERFRGLECVPTHLAFFRKIGGESIPPSQLAEAIPEQDVVFVGGGSTRSMLPVWKEWNLPDALRRACAGGTLISGMSAGAICWFEWALSDSVHGPGTLTAIPGLAWLPGGCVAHFDANDEAAGRLRHAAQIAGVTSVLGLPDGVAALFKDGQLERLFVSSASASASMWRDGKRLSLPKSVELCSI